MGHFGFGSESGESFWVGSLSGSEQFRVWVKVRSGHSGSSHYRVGSFRGLVIVGSGSVAEPESSLRGGEIFFGGAKFF